MHRPRSLVGLLLVALVACRPEADLVLAGGEIWTGLASGAPQPGAIAIARGKILAVGDSGSVACYVGPATTVVRIGSGLVVPGFVDGHTHFIDAGFQLASVELRDALTPQAVIRRIRTYARSRKRGEWILGGDWDHTLWPRGPLPRHEWIESVTPDNPGFIYRLERHQALAHAAATRAPGGTM